MPHLLKTTVEKSITLLPNVTFQIIQSNFILSTINNPNVTDLIIAQQALLLQNEMDNHAMPFSMSDVLQDFPDALPIFAKLYDPYLRIKTIRDILK